MRPLFTEQGTATITVNGIQFCDVYYSCQMAIRQQWFKKHNDTRITIRYNPADLSTFLIMRGNLPIEQTIALQSISVIPDEKYYQQLEILKKEFRSVKSRR